MFSNAPGAPAPQSGKVYTFKGTQWVQEPIGYFQFLKALDLLRGSFDKFFQGQEGVGELLEHLTTGGTVPGVMRLLLRPHNPTPIAWARNRWAMVRNGVDPKDPLTSMTLKEVADVLLDFFDLNISWIGPWIDALMKSFISNETPAEGSPDGSTASQQKSLFLSLAAEILSKPKGSGTATP